MSITARLKQIFLEPPRFADDEEKTWRAALLHAILLSIIILHLLIWTLGVMFLSPPALEIALSILLSATCLFFLVMLRRADLQAITTWLLSVLWAYVTVALIYFGGLRGPAFGGYALVVLMAGLLLDVRPFMQFAALTLLSSTVILIADVGGYLPPPLLRLTSLSVGLGVLITICMAVVLLPLYTRSVRRSMQNTARELVERRRMEGALRQSEERFRRIVENMPESYMLADMQGRVLLANQAAADMLGYRLEELHQLSIPQTLYCDPTDRNRLLDALRRSGMVRGFELTLRRKDGQAIVVEASEHLLRDERGEPVAIEGLQRDVTERRQAEDTLRASEEKFQRLFQANPVAMAVQRVSDGSILAVNDAFIKMYGYSHAEALGRTPAQLELYQWSERQTQVIKAIRDPGSLREYQVVFRRKSGETGTALVSMENMDVGGEACRLVLFQDITARKHADDELQRRADELSALYQTTRDLTAQYDLPLLLQTIVDRAAALLLVPGGGICLFDPDQQALVIKSLKGWSPLAINTLLQLDANVLGQVARTRRSMLVNDYDATAFSRTLPFDLPITALIAAPMLHSGELLGVLFVNQVEMTVRRFSASDMRLLELFAAQAASAVHNARLFEQVFAGRERLKTLSQNLIQVQEAERRNIARELHDEIGQALTALQLNTQVIEQMVESPTAYKLIQDNMTMIENLLQQVRSLSLNLRPSVLDDFGLVTALNWLVNRQKQLTGLDIQFVNNLAEVRLPVQTETACFRIAQEALTNVIRHANATRVSIDLKHDGEKLQIAIADNGVGFNLSEILQRAAKGASLGLLGLEERVTLVGGRIEINSAPGKGTRIMAEFPLSSTPPFVERRLLSRRQA